MIAFLLCVRINGSFYPQRNILITEDGKACIGDFGIWEIINASLVAAQTGTTTRQGGATRYMAPEQLTESFTGKESDVYSFAITAYEVRPFRIRASSSILHSPPFSGRRRGRAIHWSHWRGSIGYENYGWCPAGFLGG